MNSFGADDLKLNKFKNKLETATLSKQNNKLFSYNSDTDFLKDQNLSRNSVKASMDRF
jgi:hypothetical protein